MSPTSPEDDPPAEPLPDDLRARLVEQGRAVVAGQAAPGAAGRPRRWFDAASAGWYAAAAALLLAVGAWWPQLAGEPPVVAPPAAAPTPAAQRAALLASGRAVVERPWIGTRDPAARDLAGDVVWDPATQTGYLRFTGLAVNDAAVEQYQLWIFDGTRDERYPVDGGVFDVPPGAGEVVIPIHARLPVRQATMFAVTVEAPGGVVVSARERIVALAQVAAG